MRDSSPPLYNSKRVAIAYILEATAKAIPRGAWPSDGLEAWPGQARHGQAMPGGTASHGLVASLRMATPGAGAKTKYDIRSGQSSKHGKPGQASLARLS